jgi:uncharacterized membrane protein
MKLADIEKIQTAGLITDEQRQKIIEHFRLEEDGGNRFLVIMTFLGAVLITAGIVLLISAHWDEIPSGVKIVVGVLLMLGAHGVGWWLREIHGKYFKTGEALQFVGSGLFLANIALVGQTYHLVSRPPNALLLWCLGIGALPWILRSRAQFALFIAGFSVWFGCEINRRDSLIYCGEETQVLVYALLGLVYFGAGNWLRRAGFVDFAPVAEKLGAFGLLAFSYPLTWAGFWSWGNYDAEVSRWLLPTMAALGIALASTGVLKNTALSRQWQWTWAAALSGAAVLLVAVCYAPHEYQWHWNDRFDVVNAVAAIAMFVFCLLQIQVGLKQRSRFLVNLGVGFIGLDILSAYIGLFGTMARTGAMFVLSGLFLVLFGVYLEKKRRNLMRQIKTAKPAEIL